MPAARPVNAEEAQIQAVSVAEHPVEPRACVITSRCESGQIVQGFCNVENLLRTLEGLPSLEHRLGQDPRLKPRRKKLCGTS